MSAPRPRRFLCRCQRPRPAPARTPRPRRLRPRQRSRRRGVDARARRSFGSEQLRGSKRLVRTLRAVGTRNTAFTLNGVNHLALVCRDMARTVDFYTNVLGMALVKTIDLPGGGQHFFFDMGNGNLLAFFWFPGG